MNLPPSVVSHFSKLKENLVYFSRIGFGVGYAGSSRRDGSGEALRQLRKLILGIEPRCPLGSPHMRLGTVSDGSVNTSEPQDHRGLSSPLGDNV